MPKIYHGNTKNITLLVLGAACVLFIGTGKAHADQVPMQLSIECSTPPTQGDGVRHDCKTSETRQAAPENYVIAQNSIKVVNKGKGSYHDCNPRFEDYVEIIPGSGITQPKTFVIWAKAMGPSGHFAGTGSVQCDVTGFYTKYR